MWNTNPKKDGHSKRQKEEATKQGKALKNTPLTDTDTNTHTIKKKQLNIKNFKMSNEFIGKVPEFGTYPRL